MNKKEFKKEKTEGNFQIQYFPMLQREEFKAWAHKNNMSMRELLLHLIKNKKAIQKVL
jgi:hypothetical protein